MASLNRERVEQVIGPVDEDLLAEIVKIEAEQEELAEAHAWVTNDEAMLNNARRFPSGRVGQLVRILETIEGPLVRDE
ncbi:hypothetical protein [Consotaella salsifontis]|uniref:Uncharacterized protein n=1 Tax=Consotaella salsifontis TaxID=1365950 RepID=A0A1T4S9Q6_9HYPH|nr:hypothetical protein [Consotaella salsifontis]SKA24963.1 hypothetical protein SAMN05428963_109160 [Consotaella salsifontis]